VCPVRVGDDEKLQRNLSGLFRANKRPPALALKSEKKNRSGGKQGSTKNGNGDSVILIKCLKKRHNAGMKVNRRP